MPSPKSLIPPVALAPAAGRPAVGAVEGAAPVEPMSSPSPWVVIFTTRVPSVVVHAFHVDGTDRVGVASWSMLAISSNRSAHGGWMRSTARQRMSAESEKIRHPSWTAEINPAGMRAGA